MTSSKLIRICADCRHCTSRREFFLIPTEFCSHPRAVDIVTGRAWQRCVELRHQKSRLCGERGRLWEPVNVVEPPQPPATWSETTEVSGYSTAAVLKIIDRMKPR